MQWSQIPWEGEPIELLAGPGSQSRPAATRFRKVAVQLDEFLELKVAAPGFHYAVSGAGSSGHFAE